MIYVIQEGEKGRMKIGLAVDVERRIAQLQGGNTVRLRVVKVVPGDRKREASVHRDLKQFRVSGEWFDPNRHVLDYIAKLGVAEYETINGKTYLVLWRDNEDSLSPTDYCPFCGSRHWHGTGDGHRVGHCVKKEGKYAMAADGTRLEAHDGYIVRSRSKSASPAP